MKIDQQLLSINVSELCKGQNHDFYRIDLISADFKDTYTITVCPDHKNYKHWEAIIATAHETVVQFGNAKMLKATRSDSKHPATGAVRLTADAKPFITEIYERNEALHAIKLELGLNPGVPIADPFETMFGPGDQ